MSISREGLYEAVWAEPMITVATRYGVSASYLARVCECLDVPRPPRGYWAKLQFGRSTEKPKLPVAPPGRETEWTPGRSPGLYTASRVLKLPSHPDASADASLNPPATHFLLKDVQAHYDAAKVSDDGYLRPNKRLLVDVYVSKDMLARALEVANALFRELERARHPVTFASSHEHAHRPELDQREKPGPYPLWQTWRPARPTVTFVDTVAFGLTLYEISEEVEVRYLHGKYVRTDAVPPRGGYRGGDGWTTKKDMPTGRLALRAYSANRHAKWEMLWKESKAGDLSRKFRTIKRELKAAVPVITKLIDDSMRQAEIEHQKWKEQLAEWKRKEREQRRVTALKESREQLLSIVDTWGLAMRIEAFFLDAERRASGLEEGSKAETATRLERARELLGGVNALRHFDSWRSPEERERPVESDGPDAEE